VDPDRLLDGLDPSQRRAVTTPAQPLAILAGPGSGKTRVLTRRIAHRCLTGDADPRHVLAITFTRKAAQELDARLRGFGLRDLPAAGTFHAVAYAQLRTRWAAAGRTAPTLLDRKARLVARVLPAGARTAPADLAAEIEWAKARLVSPDRYPIAAAQADRRTAAPPDRIAEWYRAYEAEKRRRGLVDFDDLLADCATAIEQDPSFAAAQRWRFRHLFVDEYQDLNPLQDRLLRAWLGDRPDLAVVGDPNQAIYGWNGADPSFLVEFARHHPGAEVVRLERTYRSTPQILATAEAVLADAGLGETPAPQRSDGPVPTVVGYATEADEANGIVRAVHDHHRPGTSWSTQAVLVRTNAQLGEIEAAFRRAAIPHRVRGASSILDEPSVRTLLRDLDRSRDPLATAVADLDARLAERRDALVRDDDEDDAAPELDERRAEARELVALDQVVQLGRDLLVVDPTARAEAFSGWLRATLLDGDADRADAVTLTTFHAAKGLEWSVVHLAGLEAGLVPITHARTPQDRAEERRLLFVAVTRAADVLRCTWAAQRTFGSQTVDRRPSPFLDAVRAEVSSLVGARRDAADPISAIAASRDALHRAEESPGDADPTSPAARAVRDQLRRWRADQARKARVAPTVVLSDRAVEDLVRHRPTDADALARIPDVTPAVRERHGARLLEILAGG